MGTAIGDILPLAIAVAISPVPIIAVVLMLATPRGRTNGLAFSLGWVAGLAIVSAVVLVVESGGSTTDSGEPSTGSSAVKLAIGALFLFFAVRQWRGRPAPGEEAAMPKWMQTIDEFTAGKSLGLGAVLSGVNPKNLGITIAAALAVAQAGLSTGQEAATMVVYVALASLTILGPVVLYLALGERARSFLDGLKTWMTAHNAAIMAVLFVVIGVKLIGDAIGGLTA
jgi:threonine/homoserine/homoserine lactone efflux protein